MKLILTPIAVAACAAVGWLVYNDSLEAIQTGDDSKPADAPVAVEVARAMTTDVDDRVELVGSLEAAADVEVRSRVTGYVTELMFDVGDSVKNGQLVATVDSQRQEETVAGIEAELLVVDAQLKSKQAQSDLAQKEVERLLQLAESGVGTRQQLDQARTQVKIAAAEVELEQARQQQTESSLERAKLALEQTQLQSPLEGLVAERLVEVGDLVDPAAPLLRIVELKTVRTVVHVVEQDYPQVRTGQPAVIRTDAFSEQTFDGRVTRVAPVLDPETRTAAVQIEIDNPEVLLKPGMYARVSLVLDARKQAVLVPLAAIVNRGGADCVFVLDSEQQTAELRNVRTGAVRDHDVEIVSGLEADSQVVTLGNRLLADGQMVQIDVAHSSGR